MSSNSNNKYKYTNLILAFIFSLFIGSTIIFGIKTAKTMIFENKDGVSIYQVCDEEEWDEQGSSCISWHYDQINTLERIQKHFFPSIFWGLIIALLSSYISKRKWDHKCWQKYCDEKELKNKKNIDKDKMAELYKYFSQSPEIRLIIEYLSTHEIIVNYERSVICRAFTTHFFEIKKDNPKVIIGLVGNDIASLVRAPGGFVRIEINNKNLVIEVPNQTVQPISLNELIEKYKESGLNYKLPIMMGIDNENKEVFADLVELKHLVLAGQTGSGKSVFENAIIYTLLTLLPNSVKFLFSDMKRVEFTPYNGIPQLTSNVIIDSKTFFNEIKKLIKEKEKRLKSKDKKYPHIIAIFDTISDIVYTNQALFDGLMERLLEDAVDVKIHVIVCDSRVGENVFTPTIMSLMPTKLCFATASEDSSKHIIKSNEGAHLLGRGDVLVKKENKKELTRLQTPWISDPEINQLIEKTKENTNRIV